MEDDFRRRRDGQYGAKHSPVVAQLDKRLAKEAAEAEVAYAKGAPAREVRYQKMDALLVRYHEACRGLVSDDQDKHSIWRHLVDEYQWDLIALYQRVRSGKQP